MSKMSITVKVMDTEQRKVIPCPSAECDCSSAGSISASAAPTWHSSRA